MAEIDGNLFLYQIPSNEVLKNRKKFYRLNKEDDESIQAWQERVQSHMNCCEFPVLVSSEFHLVDKLMCELNIEEITSIKSAGDTLSFEHLQEILVIREIGANQSNDGNSTMIGESVERNLEISSCDIRSEVVSYGNKSDMSFVFIKFNYCY